MIRIIRMYPHFSGNHTGSDYPIVPAFFISAISISE